MGAILDMLQYSYMYINKLGFCAGDKVHQLHTPVIPLFPFMYFK